MSDMIEVRKALWNYYKKREKLGLKPKPIEYAVWFPNYEDCESLEEFVTPTALRLCKDGYEYYFIHHNKPEDVNGFATYWSSNICKKAIEIIKGWENAFLN